MKKKRLSKQERQLRQFQREAAHRQSKGNTIEKHLFNVGDLVKVNGDQVGVIISYEPKLFDFKFSVNKKDFDKLTLTFLDYYVEKVVGNEKFLPDDVERVFYNVAKLVGDYWSNKIHNENFDYTITTIIPTRVVENEKTGEVFFVNDFVLARGDDYVVISPSNEEQYRRMDELMLRVSQLGQVEHDASLLEKDEDGELKEMMAEGTTGDVYGIGCWGQVIDQMNAVAKKKSNNTGLYKVNLAGGEMDGQKGLTKLVAPINISSYVAS